MVIAADSFQAWIQGGVKGGDHPPPEFSKNKIEKSILACFL